MKTANEEKKTRSIRVVSKSDFTSVINDVKELLNGENFLDEVCAKTGNGLYKLTTSIPSDMTGVKSFKSYDLKWYQVPTTEYLTSLTSYISYILTNEKKARNEAIKKLKDLSTEELLALIAKK